jgi:hypothetical protein
MKSFEVFETWAAIFPRFDCPCRRAQFTKERGHLWATVIFFGSVAFTEATLEFFCDRSMRAPRIALDLRFKGRR